MSTKAKERIYLVVTVICLLMCMVLLLSVFLDRPVFGVQAAEHVPVLRANTSAEEVSAQNENSEETLSPSGIVLTEDALASALRASLPATFPVNAVGVDVSADGQVCVSMKFKRRDLEDYLKNVGVALTFRQSLALKLLPKSFSTEVCLLVACTDGTVVVTPLTVAINDDKVSLGALPAGTLDLVNSGLSAALKAAGTFTTLTFTEDAIVLG